MRIFSNKKVLILTSLVLLFAASLARAGEVPYEPEWLKQAGSTGINETIYGIGADPQYIYVTGRTNGALPGNTQTGSNDIFLAKYRHDGQRIWIRQIGAKSTLQSDYPCSINESSYAVAVDASGNSYIVGRTDGLLGDMIYGKFDVFLVKFDSAGVELWRKQIGTANQDEAYGVAIDSTGAAVYVVGMTTGSMPPYINEGGSDLLMLKYSASGSLTGKMQMGTAADDEIRAVAFRGDGEKSLLLLAGSTKGILHGANSGGKDLFFAAVSADLTSVKQIVQGGTVQDDDGAAIAVDQAGNAYIAGYSSTAVSGIDPETGRTATVGYSNKSVFIQKYIQNDALAWSEQWTRKKDIAVYENVDKLSDNKGPALAVDQRGNIYLADYIYVQDTVTGALAQKDIHVAKYSPEGLLLWEKQSGTIADDRPFAVTADSDGAVYAAGYTMGDIDPDPLVSNLGGADLFVLQFLDRETPAGSFVINEGKSYTNSATVSLEITCDDRTGSGCSQMRFSNSEAGLADEEWLPFVDRQNWTLTSGDGSKVVFGQFKDRAGNSSAITTSLIILDTVSPSGSVAINGSAAATSSSSVALSLSCIDEDGSACVLVRFTNDPTTWPDAWDSFPADNAWSWTLPAGDGSKTVLVQFMDKAGNISTESDSILLDTTAPVGSLAVNADAVFANSNIVSLSVICNDGGGSGCSLMRFNNNMGGNWPEESWEAFASDRSGWILTGEDGSKTVSVQFKDSAGNISTISNDSIQLDATRPSGTVIINAGAANTSSSSVVLTFSCSDAGGSECGHMRMSNDGTNWPQSWDAFVSVRNDWPLADGDGSRNVYVQFRDNAGNISLTANDAILVDETAPAGSLSIFSGTNYPEVTNLTLASLNLSCSDGSGTGCASMSFSNDGSSWSAWEPFSAASRWQMTEVSGAKTVYARFKDNAGNTGVVSDTITVDTTLKPDMTLVITVPASGGRGESIAVSDTTKNNGSGAADSSTTGFYLSKDGTLDAEDILLGGRSVSLLAAGTSEAGSTTLTIPADTAGGFYYIIGKADGGNALSESNETNNAGARSIKIGPDLVVSALTIPSTSGAGKSVTVSDTTKNSGAAPAGQSTTSFYLSMDAVLDANDVLLGNRDVEPLAAGTTQAGSTVLTIPSDTATATYYIIGQADADSSVSELYETNNVLAKSIKIGPDMTVTVLGAPSTAGSGKIIAVTDTTKNSGPGDAQSSITRIHFSHDNKLDDADMLLGERIVPPLTAGTTSSGSTSVTIPAALPAGTYYLIAMADAENTVAERIENNVMYRSIQVGTDMTISSLSAPSSTGCGKSIAVTSITKNSGPGDAAASTTRFYLSTDNELNAGDMVLGEGAIPAMAAGTTNSGSVSVIMPGGLASGTYFLLAQADAEDTVSELNETNNVTTRSIQIGPDLAVTSVSAPSTAGSGKSITLSDTTKNSGVGDAGQSTTRFYFSVDNMLSSDDVSLGDRSVPALPAGTSSSGSLSVTMPGDLTAGAYYIIAESDVLGAVDELNEGNNVLARSIQIGTDMTISSISAPSSSGSGKSIIVTGVTKNGGPGDAAASTTQWYFSTDSVLDAADIILGDSPVPFLAPATANSASLTVVIPAVSSAGTYYLLAQADALNSVSELNETNNVTARSIQVGPDLQVTSMSVPSTAGSGKNITITETTKNTGAGDSTTATTRFYLSTDNALDGGDTVLSERAVSVLAAGTSSSGSTAVTIPAGLPSGTYYVIAQADADYAVSELSETNNITVRTLQLGADLQCTTLSAPSSSGSGKSITITETTKNSGPGDAAGSVTSFYLSADNAASEEDILIGSRTVDALAAGAGSNTATTITIPGDIVPGVYYLMAKADGGSVIGEVNENNNTTYRTISIGPDFQVSALSAPATVKAGLAVSLNDTTKNSGGGDAASSVTGFYLSTDNIASADDRLLGSRDVPALSAGTSSSTATSVLIPADVLPGAYYLIAHTNDGSPAAAETNEANNTYARALNIDL